MTFKSFEELDCWKAARAAGKHIRSLIKKLPTSERFDLIDNMRRATRSATRNIAEGFGRYSYKENVQFCLISRGSQFELIDDVISCREEAYIDETEYAVSRNLLDKSIALLNGYINYLERADSKNQS